MNWLVFVLSLEALSGASANLWDLTHNNDFTLLESPYSLQTERDFATTKKLQNDDESSVYAKEYQDETAKIVEKMTDAEKLLLLHGTFSEYTGKIPGIPRLGLPPLYMNDGPQGFRGPPGTSTAWPCSLAFASTWDSRLVNAWSRELAKEFRLKGASVILGPAINIARVPVNGRNFEYFSGESPVLGATLARASVEGIQSVPGMIATAKHFIANSQETNRMLVSSNIGDEVLHEMYLPAFAAAVESGVLAVMCSYNKINGSYACENDYTLNRILRRELKFDGIVMSDWFATHSTKRSALASLDMEMPYGFFFGAPLAIDFSLGRVPAEVVDEKARRIVKVLLRAKVNNATLGRGLHQSSVSAVTLNLARKAAAESAVLLKNENNQLPVSSRAAKRILVVGPAAKSSVFSSGGGSGTVVASHCVTILEGLRNHYELKNMNPNFIEYDDGVDISETLSRAKTADVVLVVLGTTSSEGFDRNTLSFGRMDNNLVFRLGKIRPDTTVLTISPGAVLLPWKDSVASIISMFMPGQEMGNAFADVFFGEVCPGAKLTLTFPNKDNEMNFTKKQYPGENLQSEFSESLLVGYRWYDHYKVDPAYPFGHGLSYTSFGYSNLIVRNGNMVEVIISNLGDREGAEVVQLYLDKSGLSTPSLIRPHKELIKWEKVMLKKGQKKKVAFTVSKEDTKVWSTQRQSWMYPLSRFIVYVGSSSRDIKGKAIVDIPF